MVAGLHKEVEEFCADLFIVHVQAHFHHIFLPFSEERLILAALDYSFPVCLVAEKEIQVLFFRCFI